jgi:hypothetical protein
MSILLVGVEQGSIPPALKEEMIDEAAELVDALSKGFFSDYAERANYSEDYHLNYRTSN